MKLKIKKGDTVKLLAGDERGKTGEVIQLFKSDSRAIVKGLNIVKKHQKATKENKVELSVSRSQYTYLI